MASRKVAATSKGQPWIDLFDVTYAQSSCNAVGEAVQTAARGEPVCMGRTLQVHLIAPAEKYVSLHFKVGQQRGDILAANRLIEVAEHLVDLFVEGHPFDESAADGYAHGLYLAWLEFIAHACGWLAYHAEPKRVRQTRVAATGPRMAGKNIAPADVSNWLSARGRAVLSQDDAAEIADQFGVSAETVYRRWKAAQAK